MLIAISATRPAFAQRSADTSATTARARAIAAATQIIGAARYATLITLGDSGAPEARIVDPHAPDRDLTIWIATNPRTRKVAEIGRDPRVTLVYFNAAGGEYVTMHGTASLVTDAAEKARHWKAAWAPFYKHGPRGDDYVLLRVRPATLEVVSPKRGVNSDPATWRPTIVRLP